MSDTSIRPARLEDLPELTEIYNHYVRETAITFDLDEFSVEQRRGWFDQFGESGRHRLLVVADAGHVLGYASTHRFRPKRAYDVSVEVSIYLWPEAHEKGLGTRLYAALFEALEGEDVHRAYAGVTLPNAASLALHARFGFVPVGLYHQVGRKFERYWDVQWLEKRLG